MLRTRSSLLALRVCTGAALVAPLRHASISSAFDAGNIVRVDDETPDSAHVKLKIRPDPWTELEKKNHFQWFSFRSLAYGPTSYEIVNAGDASYATDGWRGYEVCASADREVWTRLPTTYDAARGALCWDCDHAASSSMYFAYFDTYDCA